MNKKAAIAAGILLLLLCAALFFCARPEKQVTKTTFLLDTVVSITLYGTDDATPILDCFSLCEEYERIFSKTLPNSELSRLNRREISSVSNPLREVLQTARTVEDLSGGRFTVTLGTVSTLWDFRSENPTLPAPEEIREALTHAGSEKYTVTGNTVTFTDAQTQLDLGGIAKGYIADRLKEKLLSQGVTSAMISLGGNVLCVGEHPNGKAFTIGIQKPYGAAKETLRVLSIRDKSVVTSGVYERGFTLDDTRYHHILDASTGYPVQNGLLSVTVCCENSAMADALSTACFALGVEQSSALLRQLHAEGYFITDTYEVIEVTE